MVRTKQFWKVLFLNTRSISHLYLFWLLSCFHHQVRSLIYPLLLRSLCIKNLYLRLKVWIAVINKLASSLETTIPRFYHTSQSVHSPSHCFAHIIIAEEFGISFALYNHTCIFHPGWEASNRIGGSSAVCILVDFYSQEESLLGISHTSQVKCL